MSPYGDGASQFKLVSRLLTFDKVMPKPLVSGCNAISSNRKTKAFQMTGACSHDQLQEGRKLRRITRVIANRFAGPVILLIRSVLFGTYFSIYLVSTSMNLRETNSEKNHGKDSKELHRRVTLIWFVVGCFASIGCGRSTETCMCTDVKLVF